MNDSNDVSERYTVPLDRDHLYEFWHNNGKEVVLLGRYRMVQFATMGHTGQEVVVYAGVEGPDAGRWFACPLMDWATKFKKVEPPVEKDKPSEPLPARQAGGAIPAEVHEISLSAEALRLRCSEADSKRKEVWGQ